MMRYLKAILSKHEISVFKAQAENVLLLYVGHCYNKFGIITLWLNHTKFKLYAFLNG